MLNGILTFTLVFVGLLGAFMVFFLGMALTMKLLINIGERLMVPIRFLAKKKFEAAMARQPGWLVEIPGGRQFFSYGTRAFYRNVDGRMIEVGERKTDLLSLFYP